MTACGAKKTETAQQAPAAEQVRTVEVVAAVRGEVPQESVYASTVEAWAVNNIAPQTSARIRKINVEVGDYVRKGQVLAEMDRLQLDQTHLQLVNDSTELSRIRTLYEQGGVAKSDLDAMELSYAVRQSTYRNLKENTILTSPVTGYVTARNYDLGDLYSMSAPLFTVEQVIPVKLKVGVSESEYTKVKKGDKVSIEVAALPGRTFQGRISRIYPTISAATHTFLTEVTVDNSDRALRPGMYGRVTILFGINKSIVVPDQCIVKQEGTGQKFIYVLNDDSTVSFVPITLGRHIDTSFEVLEGLEEGQKVVVKGQAGLKDGLKVNVK